MKNFFDCKDEKITEKAFLQSLLISVASILLCLVALCSMTYAWFVGETTSIGNTLVSGSFDLIVTVEKDNTDYPVTKDANNDGVLICNLTEEGTYIVTLKLKEGSSVEGHCIVKVGNDASKHTASIFKTGHINNGGLAASDKLTFSITVTDKTLVTFEPRWGVVVKPDIENEGIYPMPESANNEDIAEQESATLAP